MAYEFKTINGASYLICASCGVPNSLQPNTQDYAAYDAPDIRVDTGLKDEEGNPVFTTVEQWEVALCKLCYLKAYKLRYPEAEPPTTLFDGRLKGYKEGKTSGKVS